MAKNESVMMHSDPNVFDYIKYYALPFDKKLVMVRNGQYLNIFKNDPDPTISELAKTVIKHMTKEGAKLPIHVTLKSEFDKW